MLLQINCMPFRDFHKLSLGFRGHLITNISHTYNKLQFEINDIMTRYTSQLQIQKMSKPQTEVKHSTY